jgi:hypothetical protein
MVAAIWDITESHLNIYPANKSMTALAGAARFELPTPCAQGGFEAVAEITCFQQSGTRT